MTDTMPVAVQRRLGVMVESLIAGAPEASADRLEWVASGQVITALPGEPAGPLP